MAKGSRTYARDARGRFASGNSGGGAKAAKPKAAKPAAKAKPVTKAKPAAKAKAGRPAAKMKPVAQPASSKGAQRRSSGQANWARGFLRLNDQGLTRNKRALLSPAQQEKAQAARRVYGTHNARKMSTRKLSDQQLAKAELAKYRFGKRSTAPTAPTGTRAKATIRLSSRSGQAARVAALKGRAAGNGAGVSFSQGLRSGERVRAQQSLNRAAGKAIGKPARQRKVDSGRNIEQRMKRSQVMREKAINRLNGYKESRQISNRSRRLSQHRRAVENFIAKQKPGTKRRAELAAWWQSTT